MYTCRMELECCLDRMHDPWERNIGIGFVRVVIFYMNTKFKYDARNPVHRFKISIFKMANWQPLCCSENILPQYSKLKLQKIRVLLTILYSTTFWSSFSSCCQMSILGKDGQSVAILLLGKHILLQYSENYGSQAFCIFDKNAAGPRKICHWRPYLPVLYLRKCELQCSLTSKNTCFPLLFYVHTLATYAVRQLI